jgi:hypothetical protein
LNPTPVTVHAPYLVPSARTSVAEASSLWAAGKAVALARSIEALAGAIDRQVELVAIATSEAQILIMARAARQYSAAAGSCCPGWVRRRLEELEGTER